MSVNPLTVYLLAAFVILNLYVANGKPIREYNHSLENDKKSHSEHPPESFHPLDEDWLKAFNGGFHEIEDDDGRDGNSQSGLDNPSETTTPDSLGFDFHYLFNHEKHSERNVKNNGDNFQADDHKHTGQQNNFHISGIFDQNQNQNHPDLGNLNNVDFDTDVQGFHQGNPQIIDPIPVPFPQDPNFFNFGHQSYSARNRAPVPVWAGHGYSNGIGFPLPHYFPRGFGGY